MKNIAILLMKLWEKLEIRVNVRLGLPLVALVLVIGWSLRGRAPGTKLYLMIGWGFIALVVVNVAIYTFELGQSLRFSGLRMLVRGLRAMRTILHVPPGVKFLYSAFFLVSIFSVAIFAATNDLASFQIASAVGITLFAVAAFFDLLFRVARLLTQIWARTIGKLLSATLSALVLASALALAKHQVHSVAHVDAKYFDDFINLFVVVVSPFLYVSFLMTMLVIFALLQFIGLVIFIPIKTIYDVLGAPSANPQRRYDRQMFWYKIQHGKKPVALPPRSIFPIQSAFLCMRPFGTLTLIAVFMWLFSGLNIYTERLTGVISSALVTIQYQRGSHCEGLGADTRVVYLDRGNVSTVRVENGRYVFNVASCRFTPQAQSG